jgi:UDP-glucose 4-epimerase
MKKIGIIGCGFIGKNLLNRFLDNNISVNILSRKIEFLNPSPDLVSLFEGDVSDTNLLNKCLHGCTEVFYLISDTVPGDIIDIQGELFSNISNLVNCLNICEKLNVRQFIFFSSSSVYGLQEKFPINENAVPNPISQHAVQKLTLEHYINYFSFTSKLNTIILRLSNPFGPGQDINGRQGLISIIIGKYLSNNKIQIRGSGSDIRDYIYIDDVVDTCFKISRYDLDSGVYNLSTSNGFSTTQILETFISLGINLKVEYIDARAVDIPVSILCNKKIKNILETDIKFSIKDGILSHLKFHGFKKP